MATDQDLLNLYGMLRNSLISRHFVFSRYGTVYHLALSNLLGYSNPTPGPNGIVDSATQDRTKDQRLIPAQYAQPGSGDACRNTKGLLANLSPNASNERWRIIEHGRENPLMLGGQLLTCLAIEHVLGQPDSLTIIKAFLQTIDSLYKFRGQHPFDGYVIRWDERQSDRWQTVPKPPVPAPPAVGVAEPVICVEFLPQGGKYLYCTPLDDTRYQAAANNTAVGKILYRDWEPSMDELVGLMAGYWMVFDLVNDTAVKTLVKRHVGDLMTYLESNFYLLARPIGGFAFRGCAVPNPAFAYPFRRVALRITGSDHAMSPNFNNVLKAAGVYNNLSGSIRGWTFAAALVGIVGTLATFAAMPVLAALGGFAIVPLLALGAAMIFGCRQVGELIALFMATSGDIDVNSPSDFGQAYLLSLMGVRARFARTINILTVAGPSSPAVGFVPYLGLTALDDPDPTVRNAFRGWLSGRRTLGSDDANNPSTYGNPAANPGWSNTAFSCGIASVLGGGQGDDAVLSSTLQAMFAGLTIPWASDLVMQDVNRGKFFSEDTPVGPVVPVGGLSAQQLADSSKPIAAVTTFNGLSFSSLGVSSSQAGNAQRHRIVEEDMGTNLDYMVGLALAWLHRKRMADAGTPLPAEDTLPAVPDLSGPDQFATITIPASVVQGGVDGELPFPAQSLSNVTPNELSGVSEYTPFPQGAPPPPVWTPPPPPTLPSGSTVWILNNTQQAMGLWNASNTVTINISSPAVPPEFVPPAQPAAFPVWSFADDPGNVTNDPPEESCSFSSTPDANGVFQGTATVKITAGNFTNASYSGTITVTLQLAVATAVP